MAAVVVEGLIVACQVTSPATAVPSVLDPRVSVPLTKPTAPMSFPSCSNLLIVTTPVNCPPPANVPLTGSLTAEVARAVETMPAMRKNTTTAILPRLLFMLNSSLMAGLQQPFPQRSGKIDPDRLGLRVLLQRVASLIAAESRLLESAERQRRVV